MVIWPTLVKPYNISPTGGYKVPDRGERKMWLQKRLAFKVVTVVAMMASPLFAQDLEALAEALVADPTIPGATIGWVSADEMDWAVAGVRVAGGTSAVDLDDPWHVGSLAKSMTAVVAARLVAAGDINWDTQLDGDGPTLAALLAHTSGFEPMPSNGVFRRLSRDWTLAPDEERARLVDLATRRWLGRAGEFEYSNLGYVAAGHMLAETRAESWERLIAQELFEPLEMTGAGFGAPGRTGQPAPWGHRGVASAVDPARPDADNPPVLAPAGTIHLTTEDMLRYLRAHVMRDPSFLPQEAWAALYTPPEGQNYALGWVVLEDGRLLHSGSNTLWYAQMAVDHSQGRAGFVAVNTGDPVAERLVLEALAAVMAP